MARSSASSGESSSSKSLFFMMAAMFCGFAFLLSAGLLMTSRVIHALQLRSEGDKSIVRTPLGDYRVEKAQDVGPGLPVYPQASLVLPGGGPIHPPANVNQPQVVTSTYHTNSSREYVANWYLGHLSPEFVRQDLGPKNLPEAFQESHITEADLIFVGERGDQVRLVCLTSDDMGTKISLLRSSKQPSPAPAQDPAPAEAQPAAQSSTP
jgi:hypothetical protein